MSFLMAQPEILDAASRELHRINAIDVSTGSTVVLRQRDVEALAHDQRLEGTGLAFFDMMGITDGPLRDWYGGLMFTTEGDYHRRIRSLVSRAFTPRSVEALRAPAADMAAEAVASTHRGGDLVDAFSTLATRLMCRLLGVPDSDVPVFSHWLDALSPVFLLMTPEQIAAATTAITELQSYVDELTTRRSKAPGRGSHYCTACSRGRRRAPHPRRNRRDDRQFACSGA